MSSAHILSSLAATGINLCCQNLRVWL
jgi:hypothetical protein